MVDVPVRPPARVLSAPAPLPPPLPSRPSFVPARCQPWTHRLVGEERGLQQPDLLGGQEAPKPDSLQLARQLGAVDDVSAGRGGPARGGSAPSLGQSPPPQPPATPSPFLHQIPSLLLHLGSWVLPLLIGIQAPHLGLSTPAFAFSPPPIPALTYAPQNPSASSHPLPSRHHLSPGSLQGLPPWPPAIPPPPGREKHLSDLISLLQGPSSYTDKCSSYGSSLPPSQPTPLGCRPAGHGRPASPASPSPQASSAAPRGGPVQARKADPNPTPTASRGISPCPCVSESPGDCSAPAGPQGLWLLRVSRVALSALLPAGPTVSLSSPHFWPHRL